MLSIAERTGIAEAAVHPEPDGLHRVLTAVLALHALPDPRTFPDEVAVQCEQLLPSDHQDLRDLRAAWAERSAPSSETGSMLRDRAPERAAHGVELSAEGHRLELRATASRRVLRIALERYAIPFGPADELAAEALQVHLGPAFDHARLRAAEWDVGAAIRSLTVREQEVLALVADGRTNRDIGLALYIEPRTVEKHVEHIRTKLGARSRAEAAAKWARGVGVPFA
ncbi:MAG: response regulator transcription factor [Amnibacterium sp.]